MLDQQVDDKGTGQDEAQSMLTTLRDEAFDATIRNLQSRLAAP